MVVNSYPLLKTVSLFSAQLFMLIVELGLLIYTTVLAVHG